MRHAFTLRVSRSGLFRMGSCEEEVLVNTFGLVPGKLRNDTPAGNKGDLCDLHCIRVEDATKCLNRCGLSKSNA